MAKPKAAAPATDQAPRKYLSQSDVPAHSLTAALRVPQAIADNYGKLPTKPLRVAQALDMSLTSAYFRMLCGAAIAYGLTEGGYASELITITPLARRIVAPTKEGDDAAAKREALLRPRVIRDYLTRYNASKLPPDNIGRNILEELGVPRAKTPEVLKLILEGAQAVGILQSIKGQVYVDLDTVTPAAQPDVLENGDETNATDNTEAASASNSGNSGESLALAAATRPLPAGDQHRGRVFITHGKNLEIVDQIKEVLTFGGFTPVVAIDQESTSKPVPDKVLDDMRSCAAAIIQVGAEKKLMGTDGQQHTFVNQNVLIEIGAAMALYGRKFILLVEKGVTLPSNLQGLYEVRYEGMQLDYQSTMKLLRAFNDFRG